MVNSLLNPLDLIIPIGGPMISSLQNDVSHILSSLYFTEVKDKPTFKVFNGFLKETW